MPFQGAWHLVSTHCRIAICDGLLTLGRATVQEGIEALVLGVEPGVAAGGGVARVPGDRFRVGSSSVLLTCRILLFR